MQIHMQNAEDLTQEQIEEFLRGSRAIVPAGVQARIAVASEDIRPERKRKLPVQLQLSAWVELTGWRQKGKGRGNDGPTAQLQDDDHCAVLKTKNRREESGAVRPPHAHFSGSLCVGNETRFQDHPWIRKCLPSQIVLAVDTIFTRGNFMAETKKKMPLLGTDLDVTDFPAAPSVQFVGSGASSERYIATIEEIRGENKLFVLRSPIPLEFSVLTVTGTVNLKI
jgi:hypothetical protein